jgi:hypothetical protein
MAPKQPQAPRVAPQTNTLPGGGLPIAETGKGAAPRSTPTYQKPPAPKGWPRGDNGSVKLADPSQRHPAPRGPASPGG